MDDTIDPGATLPEPEIWASVLETVDQPVEMELSKLPFTGACVAVQAGGRVTVLAGRVTVLAGRVTVLAGRVTVLAGRVTVLAGRVIAGSVNVLAGSVMSSV